MERCLLTFGNAQFRIGERVGVAEAFGEAVGDGGNGQAVMPALESVEEVARRPGGEGRSVAAYFGRRVGYHRCRGESSGETGVVRAEVLVLGQAELEDVDIDADLRHGVALGRDDC